MAKRKLNKRQVETVRRIQEKRQKRAEQRTQKALERLESGELGSEQFGRIVVNYGPSAVVENASGEHYSCVARQNLGDLACGDNVVFQATEAQSGVICSVTERRTVLQRPDFTGRLKPLAANLDQLIIVVAPRPDFITAVLDRFLVAAELAGVRAVLLLNKTDLLTQDSEAAQRIDQRLAVYADIGYTILRANTKFDHGLDLLRAQLAGHVSMLVGQSGVGKSSLVNALLPHLDARVGALSVGSGKGRHTTSATTLYPLPEPGGTLLDSPGVWEFGLPEMAVDELLMGFAEMRPLIGHCRFSNCRHQQEPGCAILGAVDEGKIAPERLQSFYALREAVTTS